MKEEFNILNKGQIKMSFYNWLKKNMTSMRRNNKTN